MGLNFVFRTFLLVLCLVFFFFGGLSQVLAEGKSFEASQELGEITVTAEKRKENIQEIPSSISAFSDVNIEDAEIKSTFEIDAYVPNFRSYEEGNRVYFGSFSVRGITNTGFGDPALTMYIDDVPSSDFYDFNNSLFDIERIEILRGPQGTLYGQNTEAGVINIVTKKPGNLTEGSLKTGIGSYGSREIQAGIRGPAIKDKLFFGVSALYNEREGYIENIYNGDDVDTRQTFSARVQVRLAPSDRSDILFTISGEKFDDGGWSQVPLDKKKYQTKFSSPKLDDFQTWQDYIGKADLERNCESLRIEHKFSAFDFVSVTAHKYLDSADTLDGEFTAYPDFIGFTSNKTRQWSQELRFSSPDNSGTLTWIAGGYYSDKSNKTETGYESASDNSFGANLPLGTKMVYDADFGAKTCAVFGKAGLRFFKESLGLSAGLRIEKSERTMERDILFGGEKIAPNVDESQDNDQLLPKFTIDYRFMSDFMIYASAAKGYKAGGFSHAVEDPLYVEFDPETVWTYEIGLKSIWFDNRFVLNLTGFYSALNDYQDRVALDSMRTIQANAADATIWGGEAELMLRLFKGFDVQGCFGYLSAEYDNYIEPGTGKDFSGKNITFTPEYEYSLCAQYRTLSGLYLRGEMQGSGGYYFDRDNEYKQDAYATFNLKTGYEFDKFDISLSCRNIGDKEYLVSGNDYGDGIILGNTGSPRTVDLIITYRY